MRDAHGPPPPAFDPARGRAERRRVQALDDDALILAMRAGDEWAWSEFAARARPVLDGYARRARLDGGERTTCAEALLTSVALHLATPGAPTPARLAPYLVRAAVRCRRHVARDRARRQAWHAAAARDYLALGLPDGDGVVGSVVSEHARRAASPSPNGSADDAPDDAPDGGAGGGPTGRAIGAVVRGVVAELSPADRRLLTWYADGVPHRQLAEWLGVTYAAAAKRVQRLCRRVGVRARSLAAELPGDERVAMERVLRRVAERAGAGYGPIGRDDAPPTQERGG